MGHNSSSNLINTLDDSFKPFWTLIDSIDNVTDYNREFWRDILKDADRFWNLNGRGLLELCEEELILVTGVLSRTNIEECVKDAMIDPNIRNLYTLCNAQEVISSIFFLRKMITKLKESIRNKKFEEIVEDTRDRVKSAREWEAFTITIKKLKLCDVKTGIDKIDSVPFTDYIISYYKEGNDIIYLNKWKKGPIKNALSFLGINRSFKWYTPERIMANDALIRFMKILWNMQLKGYLIMVWIDFKINFVLEDE